MELQNKTKLFTWISFAEIKINDLAKMFPYKLVKLKFLTYAFFVITTITVYYKDYNTNYYINRPLIRTWLAALMKIKKLFFILQLIMLIFVKIS